MLPAEKTTEEAAGAQGRTHPLLTQSPDAGVSRKMQGPRSLSTGVRYHHAVDDI